MNKLLVNSLKERFIKERLANDRKGVYAKTQKMMAYNSNKIEGSTLTSEQTASLFDVGTIRGTEGEIYRAKDIEEMNGHFSMFNYMLDTLDEELTEKVIKGFHYHLKTGVFEDIANGYPVGEYKNRYNTVSDIETSTPSNVEKNMQELLKWYNDARSFETIIAFHAKFEKIHPFQDGNGRVGRMIIFRECLKNNIMPAVIKDEFKTEYYHVLHEAQVNENYEPLFSFCRTSQENYAKEITPFLEEPVVSHNAKAEMRLP